MTGEEIKALRMSLGLTQSELAEKIGTTKHRVSDWENNKHKAGKPYVILMNQLRVYHNGRK
jgi:DNA-binding transcriptional regulator YiaG